MGVSRQRPVSCHFCRSRKLRCSRQFPCSNCSSRGLSCQLYSAHPVAKSRQDASDPRSEEILARLSRLEDLVLGKDGPARPRMGDAGERLPSQTPFHLRNDRDSTADVDWLERVCMHQSSSVRSRCLGCVIATANRSVDTLRPRFCPMRLYSGCIPSGKFGSLRHISTRMFLRRLLAEIRSDVSGFLVSMKQRSYSRSMLVI